MMCQASLQPDRVRHLGLVSEHLRLVHASELRGQQGEPVLVQHSSLSADEQPLPCLRLSQHTIMLPWLLRLQGAPWHSKMHRCLQAATASCYNIIMTHVCVEHAQLQQQLWAALCVCSVPGKHTHGRNQLDSAASAASSAANGPSLQGQQVSFAAAELQPFCK